MTAARTHKLVPPRTPDEWLASGRRVYDDFLAALERYDIAPASDLALVPGETPTPYYEHATRTIVLGMPDPAKISGRLHWLMIARLVGAAGVDDAVAHLGTQLPVLVAHEVTHHLRHHYDAMTENNFLEEQVANIVAIAFVKEDPDLRASLEKLEVDAEASIERLSAVSPSTVPQLGGFRPDLASILVAEHELTPERLDEVRELGEALDLPLDEAVVELGGISRSDLRRALEHRERCERYFNLHYLSSFSEYALFFSDWYRAYLDGGQIPSLADAIERYLLTPEWESAHREASIAFVARAVVRGSDTVAEAAVEIAAEEFGPDALEVLRVAAASSHDAARAAAFRTCASLGVTDVVIRRRAEESLDATDVEVRASAAALVTASPSPRARRGGAVLDEMIASYDLPARLGALRAVAEVNPKLFQNALTEALEAAEPAERALALRGLRHLPPSAALGALASARLTDPDDRVRREAASALHTHPGNLSLLVDALDDPDWSVRDRVADALLQLSPPAREALASCRSLRCEVAVALALSAAPGSGARRLCRGLLERLAERERALETASASVRGQSAAARVLGSSLMEARDEVRASMLKLLAARSRDHSVARVLRGLDSPDQARRSAAVEVGNREFEAELTDLTSTDGSQVRSGPGRAWIERLLTDDDPALRIFSAGYLVGR